MKKIFLFLSFVFISCSSFYTSLNHPTNVNRWKLVYYNSRNGEVINGNISSLIKAVKRGKEIRIVIESDSIVFAADAEYLWVKNKIVYAQNNGSVSVKFKGDDLVFQKNSYYWMFIVNTNGERQMIRWLVGEHSSRGNNQDRVAVKWFVKN